MLQKSNKQGTHANYIMGTGVQIENIAKNLGVCVCVVTVLTKRDVELKEERLHIFIYESLLCLTAIMRPVKNG
jgi:hypothetical protein